MDLPAEYARSMIGHAVEENPNECCGILAAKDGAFVKLYRITNAELSPYRYSMDSKELFEAYREIDDNGWDLAAIYHSHTHSPAYPSATDVRLASWPDAHYLLVSLMDDSSPQLRCFRISESEILEEEIRMK